MNRMSDHEFEKQVQARMEHLKMRPSGAVWTEVEKHIRKDKRRRRMILWLPVFLLLMGAGGYMVMKNTQQTTKQDLVKQPSSTSPSSSTKNTDLSANSTQPQDANQQAATPDNNNTQAASGGPSVTDQPSALTDVPPATNNKVPGNTPAPAVATNTLTGKKQATVNNPKEQKHPQVITEKAKAGKNYNKKNIQGRKNKPATVPVDPTHQDQIAKDKAGKDTAPTGEVVTAGKDAKQPLQDVAAVPAASGVDSSIVKAHVADSVGKDNTFIKTATLTDAAPVVAQAKQDKKKKHASKWQWGLQAEAGYSGITKDGLFGLLDNKSEVADLALMDNAMSYAPQFPRPVNKASSITMGPAFSIGGFVQRSLSRRLSLSAGLQYTYLSARTVVGNRVDNTRTVNRAPNTAQLVSSYYDANNNRDYTNRYHFIELPVTLHTQLNKGKRLPLVWDAGFSVSRLLGTTALHYDGLSGVYYKDNELFNRLQWVASTGFNVGLFHKTKYPLYIGPMLRYNISGVLKKDYSTGQHLWSVGLRASILLKK
jgi:hypothetical protein